MLTIKEYRKVESLEEAYTLNQKKSNRIIGGMLWLKQSKGRIQTAIDLSGLSLDTIEESEDAFSIGCMVTLRQLEQHEGLAAYTGGAMKKAVEHLVGVQFRNLATVGGSIYGRYGFSDVLTLFLAMDCQVKLYAGGLVPLAEYAAAKYDRDVLEKIIIRKEAIRLVYQSVRNTKTDFPVLTCAAARIGNEYRFVYGARPGRARRLVDEQNILKRNDTTCVEDFVQYARKEVPVSGNLRGSSAYRTHLVGILTERALYQLDVIRKEMDTNEMCTSELYAEEKDGDRG